MTSDETHIELRPERLTLTVEDAAGVLGIGRSLAYDLVATGELPSVRLGRRIVIPRAAIDTLLRPNAVG